MISDPRFNSFVAYVTMNQFGLANSQLNHYMVPAYTLLKKKSILFKSIIQLT